MFTLIRNTHCHYRFPNVYQKRSYWEYVNRMFNNPDQDRINKVGPDRACAEWVLRNGGTVIWANGIKQSDYNALPSDDQKVPHISTIDGSNSSISHYGFPHLSGCKKLTKIILHDSSYIDDRAIKGLLHGKETLTHLQISECGDVSDTGLKELKALDKLEMLILFSLSNVTNLDEVTKYLKNHLPNCKVEDKNSFKSAI